MVNYKVTLVCPLWRRLQVDGQDFFTSYDEVYESFDAMGLQENLLRGIYAYGECNNAVFLSSNSFKDLFIIFVLNFSF